jgi:hypothetical protein
VNKLSLKNAFLTTLQVPVSLGLAIFAFAEMHFTYWMLALENPLSHPMTDRATNRAKDGLGTANVERDETFVAVRNTIKQDNYRAFKDWLLLHNDEFIDRIRVVFETDFVDLMTDAMRRDRHLYAVLKPTRHENIRRIDNVFWALTTKKQDAVIAAAFAGKERNKRP